MKLWKKWVAWRMKSKINYLLKHGQFKLLSITRIPDAPSYVPHSNLAFEILEPVNGVSCGKIQIQIDQPAIKIVRDWYSNTAQEFSKKAYEKLLLQRKHNQVPK